MKKHRAKKRNIILLIFIILVILIEIINPVKLYNKYLLSNLNYNEISIENILKNNLKDEVLEIGYNETLDNVLKSPEFKIDNFSIYSKINYYEFDNFTTIINSLIEKGYTDEEINNILKSSDEDSLNNFLEHDYIENISNYLKYDFSILKNIDRYLNYEKNNNLDNETVVIYVNIGLDNNFYESTNLVTDFSFDMLVNRYNNLNSDFVPDNLEVVPNEYSDSYQRLNSSVLKAFMQMSEDCKKATGYKLLVRSGYRDYQSQEKTYNSYLKSYGKTYAENYVAHPGFSEHQTGLAIDVKAQSKDVFFGSKESEWTYLNAHKYGFILRYKKEFENITGTKYESWHFRYVGNEIASYIYENNISYEEYYVRFLMNK